MNETPDSTDLNPHFASVIGFVNGAGELTEGPADMQYNLLINVGEENGVSVGERVLVFGLGPNISDPVSGDDLGCFEVVRGEGRVKSVQQRMAVVTSTETRSEMRRKNIGVLSAFATGSTPEYESVSVTAPFKNPTLGDRVRFV